MASTEGTLISSEELLKAQAHLWNDMFAFMRSFSLKCAIELGIPDAMFKHGKPITIHELAATLSIPSCRVENLRRFMSLLVHGGYFLRTLVPGTNQEVYSLTPNSMILVREQGTSMAPVIKLALCPYLMDPWQSLAAWFKSEQLSTAFEMCHGVHFWDGAAKMPEFGRMLREGFNADAAMVAKVIIEKCADQFRGIKSLVEVGGKSTKIAEAVARAFPHIKCAVFDLPHIIDATENKCNLMEYVAGDMFERIPPADALILRWVLMTWSDEECVKILKRCKEAIPPKEKGGKAIIIEKVLDAGVDNIHPRLPIIIEKVLDAGVDYIHPRMTETQIFFDMQTMVQVPGKQRTENEWKKLFMEAGFKECKIIPALGMRCIIEIYH